MIEITVYVVDAAPVVLRYKGCTAVSFARTLMDDFVNVSRVVFTDKHGVRVAMSRDNA